MKGLRLNKSIEFFFVVLIIIGLCISAVVLMDAGKKAYGRIIENNKQLENARIALSYLGMKLRQDNVLGAVTFIPQGVEGKDAVRIMHSGDMDGMVTYIYHDDGALREIFTWDGGEVDTGFSEPITSIGRIDMSYENGVFRFTAYYTEDGYPRNMMKLIGVLGE